MTQKPVDVTVQLNEKTGLFEASYQVPGDTYSAQSATRADAVRLLEERTRAVQCLHFAVGMEVGPHRHGGFVATARIEGEGVCGTVGGTGATRREAVEALEQIIEKMKAIRI